jgi:TldD protein
MIPRSIDQYATLFTEQTELRMQENRTTSISVVDGTVMGNSQNAQSGVSARVWRAGAWGFSSSPELGPDAVRSVIRAATENARFLDTRLRRGAAPLPASPGTYEADFATRKPRMSQREMIEFLREIDATIARSCPGLTSRTVRLAGLDMEKCLATSEGTRAYSMVPRSIIYVSLTTEAEGTPVELYEAFGGRGQFEDVFDSPASLEPQIVELHAHLRKKADGVHAEAGIRDCVLDSRLAGVLAHEAVGHTTEADLVLGGSVAGDRLGAEVASPLVTMVDFAHTALGATCPVPVAIDDEGTTATDAVLIERGILKGFMHNRESAAHFSAAPTGNARASAFSDEPLVRMRNTAILPGTSTLDEMIGSIEDGYYLMRFNNGQADSTSEFMFGIVQGYEIRKGRIGRGIRDTTISGVAFDMLKTVSRISRDMSWSCSGTCGKKQGIPVGMGGPAIACKVAIGGR